MAEVIGAGQVAPVMYDYGADRLFLQDDDDLVNPIVTAKTDPLTGGLENSAGGVLYSTNGFAQGFSVSVRPMTTPVDFSGGAISVRKGTWFVGVDLYSKSLICLPRLGHQGWVPALKVVASETGVIHIEDVSITAPQCRIPNTLHKVATRQPIEVTVMGSSLMLAYDTSYWPRMLFSSFYGSKQYRLPTTITARYLALGGNASVSQLAQAGYAAQALPKFSAAIMDSPSGTVGQSYSIAKSDLVVIGLLANSWEYNREVVEPVVRSLRRLGVEVLLVTDNQGGVTAGMTQEQYQSASTIFPDAKWIFEVADKYGCAVADTAAYVLDAYYRIGYSTIYADEIHQKRNGTTIAGPSSQALSGAEVWAKAVRSLFPCEMSWAWSQIGSYNFATTKSPWVNTGSPVSAAISGGYLVVVADSATDGVALNNLGNVAGDNIRVTVDVVIETAGAQVNTFLYNQAWSSVSGAGPQTITASGSYDFTFNATDDNCTLVFWSSGSVFGTWKITNVVVYREALSTSKPACVSYQSQRYENILVKRTNFKLPGMAQLILAPDEYNVANSTGVAGTLTSLPISSSSFVRAHKGLSTVTPDTLTLATGKEALVGGYGCVGIGVFRPGASSAANVSVYDGATLVGTASLDASPSGDGWYSDIISPSAFGQSSATPDYKAYRIVVTSGTLVAQAFVVLSSEVGFYSPAQLAQAGAGIARATATSGLKGLKTSTAGDAVSVVSENRRVQWIVSTDTGTNSVSLSSDYTASSLAGASSSEVYETGGLLGSKHRCTLVSGDMVIGGAVAICDR